MTTLTKSPSYIFSDELPWQRPRNARSRYLTRCPWHSQGQEHSASLSVDEDKGLYHCFACHTKGKILDRQDTPQNNVRVTSISSIAKTSYRNKSNIAEKVYRHRHHVPSPRAENCNRWTRVYYEDNVKKKAVRLLCWLWSCQICFSRLKLLWKSRIEKAMKNDVIGFTYIIVLTVDAKIGKQLSYLRRWAKSEGVQMDYIHIKGGHHDYLFLGKMGMFLPENMIEERFPMAHKVIASPSQEMVEFTLDQALGDIPEYEYGARRIRVSKKFVAKSPMAKMDKGKGEEEGESVAGVEGGEGVEVSEEKKGAWLTVFGSIEKVASDLEAQGNRIEWFGTDYFEVVSRGALDM